jgi:choice-of-anchor A domain-containing protein
MTRTLTLLALGLAAGSSAFAAPVAIDEADFSGSENVVTFDGLSTNTPIASLYSGVTFTGLYADTPNAFRFTSSGGVIAANFKNNTTPCYTITATFDELTHRVGFTGITNSGDDTTIEVKAYDSGSLVSTGTVDFVTDLTPTFVGLEDSDGFDQVVITASGGSNSCLAMNDFLFETVVYDADGDGIPDDEDDCPDEDPATYYGYDVGPDGCISDLINAGGCPTAAAIRRDVDYNAMSTYYGVLARGDVSLSGATEGSVRVFGDGDLSSFNFGTDPMGAAYSYFGTGSLYARSGTFENFVRSSSLDADETVSFYGGSSLTTYGGHISGYMSALSADIANHNINGDTTVQSWGTVEFSGSHPMMNTFEVSAADFGASTYMTIDVPSGSSAIINVTGTSATFGPTGVTLTGVDATDVIYNFPDATTLDLAGVSIKGQVLAPDADIDFVSGDVTGTVTGYNIDGTITQYNAAFDNRACAEVEAKAAPECSVSHTVTGSWGSGYNASVTITNTGTAASSWSAGWTFGNGESVSSGWGGTWSQSGTDVSITNASWNGAIAAGGSVTIGYTGSGSPAALSAVSALCE